MPPNNANRQQNKPRPMVFISYSRKDEAEKDQLLAHLKVLQREGLITLWSDAQIGPGDEWKNEISQSIAQAKVAVLLVSANFLTSDFNLRREVPALLQRHERENLTIFPIIAKACAWRSVYWLSKLNIRPRNGHPVWRDDGRHADEDLALIAEEIGRLVHDDSTIHGGHTVNSRPQINPFIHHSPVYADGFVGRTHEVTTILGHLSNRARVSSAICGDPRVGRTSLLHYLCTPKVHEEWGLSSEWCYLVYLDCHNISPFSRAEFWRHTLRILEQRLGADQNLSARIRALLAQDDIDTFDINYLFDNIAQAGKLVVLMLDEFEWVTENLEGRPDFLNHLRSLLNRPERGLVLVVATRTPLRQVCEDFHFGGSPFDNAFIHIFLSPFAKVEVDELLARYDVNFSPAERRLITQIAGTHPYLVQLAGSLLVQARGFHLSDQAIQVRAEIDFEHDTEGYFTDVLKFSTESEKMLLTWLAVQHLNRHLPDGYSSLENLDNLFENYAQEKSRLIRRGLILEQPDGLTLFSRVFGRWILHKIVVGRGKEVLSTWAPYYNRFLSSTQKNIFEELVDKVTKWPIIIKTPHLLPQLDEPDVTPLPVPTFTNQVVGSYSVVERIGGGGMAEVFKAQHMHLDRWAAIKRMHTDLTKDEAAQTRFLREARAVAGLRHPNIVQIYDFGILDDTYYMVMEYIEGHNLKEHLQNNARLSWEEIVQIITPVANALDYAHQQGMIHRDVKPSNILLTPNNDVFLADFGVVRMLNQTDVTQTGAIVGTPAYMAPEQMTSEDDKLDHRADIYALGCIVYEMLTGRLPRQSKDIFQVITNMDTPPPAPNSLVSDLPQTASRIILQTLAKEPADRPASAVQFINALRQAFDL